MTERAQQMNEWSPESVTRFKKSYLLHTVQALSSVDEAVMVFSVQQIALCQIPQLEHVMADLPPA